MIDTAGIRSPGVNVRFARIGLSSVLLTLIVSIFLYSQTDTPILSGEFWVELDPAIQDDGDYPLSRDDAARRLLEEARFVYSGMIYGFTFIYTPFDSQREVEEIFLVTPVAEIPWGDPSMSVAQMRVGGNRQYAIIRFFSNEHHAAWLSANGSNLFPVAAGFGSGDVFKGYREKMTAIQEAMKEAIRSYLRPRFLNKPKEVSGSLSLTEVPYLVIDAGQYVAKVSIRIDLKEVVPYRLY